MTGPLGPPVPGGDQRHKPVKPDLGNGARAAEELEAPTTTSDVGGRADGRKGAVGLFVRRVRSVRLADLDIQQAAVPVLLLILLHVTVSVVRGDLSLYTLPIWLWLIVAAGLLARQEWTAAFALVLISTEFAFMLIGVAPQTVNGLPYWLPIDFLMFFARIVTGLLIWRLSSGYE